MMLAAVVAVLLVGGGPPAAPRTDLMLSYMAAAGYAAAVRLTCDAGDVHPRAAEACAVLRAVDGDPGRIPPALTMCTMEYAPITATAQGVFRGRAVDWSQRYGNACEMHRATGALFTF